MGPHNRVPNKQHPHHFAMFQPFLNFTRKFPNSRLLGPYSYHNALKEVIALVLCLYAISLLTPWQKFYIKSLRSFGFCILSCQASKMFPAFTVAVVCLGLVSAGPASRGKSSLHVCKIPPVSFLYILYL